MIEEALVNYGVLGIWTLTLLLERYKNQQNLNKIITNNTTALTKVYEIIEKCRKRKV
jgi:hypothetical protein